MKINSLQLWQCLVVGILLGLLTGLMGACELEDEEDDLGNNNVTNLTLETQPNRLTTGLSDSLQLSQDAFLGAEFFSSDTFTIEIPSDTISFGIYVFGDGDNLLAFKSLSTPAGEQLIDTSSSDDYYNSIVRPFTNYGFNSLQIPTSPHVLPQGGIWKFQVTADEDRELDLAISIRRGTYNENSALVVQPFLASSVYTTLELTEALNNMVATYAQNGITMIVNDVEDIAENQFTVLSTDFSSSTTSELLSNGKSNALNVFFADDLFSLAGSVLGIASGIPGSLGLNGKGNGALINLSSHELNDRLNSVLLGETITHEMGHLLGLYHLSESDGITHDPLNDTEQCGIENDINKNGTIEAFECVDQGVGNVMFYTPALDRFNRRFDNQDTFSDDQVFIINSSMIAY